MIGQTVSSYRILRSLQRFEDAYVAQHTDNGQEVVLKFVSPSMGLRQVALQRVEQAVRTLAELTSSGRNVVKELVQADGHAFLVLEPAGAAHLLTELRELGQHLNDAPLLQTASLGSGAAAPERAVSDVATLPGSEHVSSIPAHQLAPGRLLGARYRLIAKLGSGGMGEVWHAFDLKLQVEVALKSLRRERFPDKESFELLRHEVRAGREVHSPNVCRIYDLVEQEGQELLSMEYVDGQTLTDFLCEHGPLDPSEAGRIASQFLAGLEAVHEAGLIHRDVKPENVMITRTGRVVVMDFGIAQALSARPKEEVAGTLPYMAPEVLHGEPPDLRTDLYAAGVVLAEMISPDGVADRAARERIWRSVRESPPNLSIGAWKPVLERALAPEPAQRFATSRELALALESVTPRVVGADDREPYPGLETFSETESDYFHGREGEVEALWKRIQRSHLLAVIGASGSGKSSFLRAGVIPTRPEGWVSVFCQPGANPFLSLARVFAPMFKEDHEMVDPLLQFEDVDVAVSVVRRWRRMHEEALIIVDQFEELFTQCSKETQARFVRLLQRLALDVDVHVVLSMRDDFLIQCQAQPPLSPVFAELTPLGPLTGNALRRALVQPALACGYRFEDEELIEEILDDVRGERGALPLLAFAMSRLWERRDRETGRLTRAAYEELGRVGGALAQHAESTLERIGKSREEIVREIFRNLVTAQGTRAALTAEDLGSVFAADEGSRAEAAQEVIRTLVDARLLTSYEETVDVDGVSKTQHRVEVVHESLFQSWPRLVQWRAQDAGSARLRDQLRQAAQLWNERGRSKDLLWSGAAFHEYQAWRERYPGRLTTTEEAFARSMTARSEQQRRRRQRLMAAVMLVFVGAAAVFAKLWLDADGERRRAEASRLLMLGRSSPSAKLSYAIASLELHDAPETRRFALEVLWRGPVGFRLRPAHGNSVDFSPDGNWLATGVRTILLWPKSGGEPIEILPASEDKLGTQGGQYYYFGPQSKQLVTAWYDHDKLLRFHSVPDGRLATTFEFPSPPRTAVGPNHTHLVTRHTLGPNRNMIQVWSLTDSQPRKIAEGVIMAPKGRGSLSMSTDAIDPSGQWLASIADNELRLSRIQGSTIEPVEVIGRHDRPILGTSFHPSGDRVASVDESGEIRIWSITNVRPEAPLRRMAGHGPTFGPIRFDPSGTFLATAGGDNSTVQIWDLRVPADARPIEVRSSRGQAEAVAFDPNGQWIATGLGGTTMLWPLNRRRPYTLDAHESTVVGVAFDPNGKWLASVSQDRLARLWDLSGQIARRSWNASENQWVMTIAAAPSGEFIVTSGLADGNDTGVHVISLVDDRIRDLPGPTGGQGLCAAVDPTSRFVAVGFTHAFSQTPGNAVTRVYDLETGEFRELDSGEDRGSGIVGVQFTSDGFLLTGDKNALRRWNLDDGIHEILLEKVAQFQASYDGRYVVTSSGYFGGDASFHDLEAGTSTSLASHGTVRCVALDPTSRWVVTGDALGTVRVGPVSGDEPHLLLGHEGAVVTASIDPSGQWIATGSDDGTVRMWPVPEGEPLYTLSHDTLLRHLRSLTNIRVVWDDERPNGYRYDFDSFPGWKSVPTW